MNIEVLTAEINNNEPHTFTFSQPVTQYMVGFSKFVLQYKPPDHHIKKIVIDLSNCRQAGSEVVVTPNLVFDDCSKKSKPGDTSVTLVVVAAVGAGNPSVQLHDGLNANFENSLPSETAVIKSAIFSSSIQFNDTDHHLYKYQTIVTPTLNGNKYNLEGHVSLADRHHQSNNGQVRGSVIIFDKNDPNIICQDFDSNSTSCFGPLFFDNVPAGFNPDAYQVACFLNGYQVSFAEGEDHHVLKIDVSVDAPENKITIKDGRPCVILKLNAFLTDNGKNKFNTPHNGLSGFVIAFKKA